MNYPDNPFLQLTLPRVTAALKRLKHATWKQEISLEVHFAGGGEIPVSFPEAKQRKFKQVPLPFEWGMQFDQGWFRLDLPAVSEETPLFLHWNEQGESTLYLKGVPYYGFDVAHKYCPLPSGRAKTVYLESMCLQSAIWHPDAAGLGHDGSTVSKAVLCSRNEEAWKGYHDLLLLFELACEEGRGAGGGQQPHTAGVGYHPPVSEAPVLYRRLLRLLDDAVNTLDRDGIPAMNRRLREGYTALEGQHERITCVLTGHAHIDLVWLWPEKSSEYKAVHTFATMNRLMDAYPEFVFGYSQPASYQAVQRYSPPLMKEVRKRIEKGSWEPVGATEVESDTLIACGEGLARSFLYGQRGYRELQGHPSRVLWIPDVFGYCGSLPQIMKQTGVDFFFTTKLTWCNLNEFPYSSFVWRGIDGTEVLVHVTQGNGYNQTATPGEIRKGAEAYRQSDVHDEYLAPTGYGDGGGGVTEEMLEKAKRARSLAGMPETRWGRIDGFFDRLAKCKERLPVWQGELYLEYHRGVLTTHGNLKEAFRKSERALQTWEAARAALGKGELEDRFWKRVVFAQFHDYIPGSSIWEVYEEGLPELRSLAEEALTSASHELGGGGEEALFNPLPRPVYVVLPGGEEVAELPPLSGRKVKGLRPTAGANGLTVSSTRLKNDRLAVRFDKKGRIRSLQLEGETIPQRGPLNDLMLYPDHPHQFQAWDIDRQTLSLGHSETSPATCRVEAAAVIFSRNLGENSTVEVRYEAHPVLPVLQITYDVDWQEKNSLLKAVFPTEFGGTQARFGAPFGSVLRSQIPGRMRDEAMFESAASRWAAVSDEGEKRGLAVMTESKYGCSCREGVLGLSLIRSPQVTGEDLDHDRLFMVDNRRGGDRPVHSDIGKHRIRIALALHSLDQPRHVKASALADSLFTPVLPYNGHELSAGFLGLEGSASLQPVWAKPAEDGKGWILRLNETLGQRGKVKLLLEEGVTAHRTDLPETDLQGPAVRSLPFTPYELISLRISNSR